MRSALAKRTSFQLNSIWHSTALSARTKISVYAQAMYGSEVGAEDAHWRPKKPYGVLRRVMRIITGLPYYVRNSDLLRSLEISDPAETAKSNRVTMIEKMENTGKEYIRRIAARMRQLS